MLSPANNFFFFSITVMKMLTARNITFSITTQMEEKLTQAGFVDVEVKLTKIPLNHGGKVGKLLWDDYHHVYTNVRPAMVSGTPEWEEPDVYSKLLHECGEECKRAEANLLWFSAYGRKPSVPTEA